MLRKVTKILLGVGLIALGVSFFVVLEDFNIVVGTIVVILGVSVFFFDFTGSDVSGNTDEAGFTEDEQIDVMEEEAESDLEDEETGRR